MADIDVSFSTNAAQVAPQINQAASATSKASTAVTAHTVAVGKNVKELGFAIQAARLHGTATKEEINAMRIAQLELRKKAQAEALVADATKKAALASKAAAAADAQRAAAERAQGLAVRQRGIQGAGFLGAGRFATGAQALVGKDAGLGALAGGIAAMAGVGIAIGLLTDAISKWWGKVDEQIKATEKLSQQYDDIKKSNMDRGVNAANQFGSGLTLATALGRREQAQILMEKGAGAQDAFGAVAAADRYGENSTQALGIASALSKTLGLSLVDALDKMQGLRLGDSTASAVASKMLGRRVTRSEFGEMSQAVGASSEVAAVQQVQMAGSVADQFGISQMGRAAPEALREAMDLQTAETRKLAEELAAYNESQRLARERDEEIRRMLFGFSILGNPITGLMGAMPGGNR